MAADGSGERRLTTSPAIDHRPRWSPDGASIAFASGCVKGREADVHIMRADGSDERAVTSYAGREESACWSPEGDYLAFQAEHDGNFEIYVIGADGTGIRRLTRDPAADNWPTWTR